MSGMTFFGRPSIIKKTKQIFLFQKFEKLKKLKSKLFKDRRRPLSESWCYLFCRLWLVEMKHSAPRKQDLVIAQFHITGDLKIEAETWETPSLQWEASKKQIFRIWTFPHQKLNIWIVKFIHTKCKENSSPALWCCGKIGFS